MTAPQFPDALVARAAEGIPADRLASWKADAEWAERHGKVEDGVPPSVILALIAEVEQLRAVLLAVGPELQAAAWDEGAVARNGYRAGDPSLRNPYRADHLAPAPANAKGAGQ